MEFYKNIYGQLRRLLREIHNTLVSPDVTTFAIVSTVIVTVIYLV